MPLQLSLLEGNLLILGEKEVWGVLVSSLIWARGSQASWMSFAVPLTYLECVSYKFTANQVKVLCASDSISVRVRFGNHYSYAFQILKE